MEPRTQKLKSWAVRGTGSVMNSFAIFDKISKSVATTINRGISFDRARLLLNVNRFCRVNPSGVVTIYASVTDTGMFIPNPSENIYPIST